MPIYEYRCSRCGKKSSRIWMSLPSAAAEKALGCPSCGVSRLVRLFSRFSFPKSEEKRMESLMDESTIGGLDENDPKGMARLMRKVSEQTGEPLEGEDVEMLERMENGEMPPDDPGSGPDSGDPGGEAAEI